MNILELQDNLKDLPDNALMQEMQAPTGSAPQFLVLSELKRRKRMRDDFQRQQNADMPTVAEEVVTAAGMPREGIMGAARAMAPNTNMAQNTGMDTATPIPATRAPQPQMMAEGGIVRMANGGLNPMTQYPAINPLIGNVDLNQIAAMLQSGADKEALIANFGVDAVREAESMLLDKDSIGQIPLGTGDNFSKQRLRLMEQRTKEGFKGEKLPPNFGNKSYRDPSQSTYLGGEGIESVSKNIEDFTLAPLADERRDDDPELPEDPLRPRTGFGSNSAYTYETFLEETGLNDVPQAQEMFIRYKDYMNERGPTSAPTVMGEGPSLQEINPDSTTFVAPEVAGGTVESPINKPFVDTSRIYDGFKPFDSVPKMNLDTPLSNRQIIDSGVGIRGTDTKASQELAEFLASRRSDLPGANLPGESNPYIIDPDAAAIAGQAILDSPQEVAEDKPTFMGDVVPFLGRASVAAGKSLYDSFFPTDASAEFIKTREQELVNNTDPTQDEINRLRAIIDNPDASAPEKANAANDLMKLQERIAVTQTGGNIAATVEGQGIELEAPYIMGPFGPMIDPDYKTPGKTGQSIVDAAAVEGTDALKEIEDTSLYPDNVIREAEKIAKLSDYEAAINPINKNIMDVQNNLKNPYLPDDARAELETFLETAQQQKNELVNQTSVDELFVPPSVENAIDITGGYKGLIDTSPVTIAQQAAKAAEDTAEDTTDASAEFIKTREQVLPTVTTDDDPNKKLPITDGGEGGAGFGSTDSRIAKMLSERQKQSESDKWMALAQAGFQIMASKSPTLLGAVGEGGQAGLKALSASKKGKQAFDADMLKLQTQLDIANIRADATRGESGKASATAYAALERAYSDALTAATENPTAPNLAKLEELESMIRAARSAQFGTVTAGNTNSGVIKTPSAQTG